MRLDITTEGDGSHFTLDGEVLQCSTMNLHGWGRASPPKLTINDITIPPPFSVYRDGVPLVIWAGP